MSGMPRRRRSRAISNATKLMQLGMAAPQVVAHRVTRMASAGRNPSARDRREFTGMVVEKQIALMQAWAGMATATLQMQQRWWLAAFGGRAPSLRQYADAVTARGIAPFHRKAVSNSKRLARSRRR